jgi:hypothetical protein
VPALLGQVEGEIASVTADGAYDGEPVYHAATSRRPDRPPDVVIPPRSSAVASTEDADAEPARTPHPAHRGEGPHGLAEGDRLWPAQPRRDGLFTKHKFCLTREGRLALSWRRGPLRPDRFASRASTTVLGGSCPLGAGHEGTALDGGAEPGQPPGGGATVGSGLPAAPRGARRGSRRPRGRHPGGRTGGEPPCR